MSVSFWSPVQRVHKIHFPVMYIHLQCIDEPVAIASRSFRVMLTADCIVRESRFQSLTQFDFSKSLIFFSSSGKVLNVSPTSNLTTISTYFSATVNLSAITYGKFYLSI